MAHPLQRFLGLAESSDAHTLLDLPAVVTSMPQIDTALRRQLARVHKHPDGNSSDGELVKCALRAAAERLKLEYIKARKVSEPAQKNKVSSPTAKSEDEPPKPMIHQTPKRSVSKVISSRQLPTIRLTDFDRAVLAVLVGCGGWNAEARSRLVTVSSVYGVTVQGLMRVITGLSNYSRSGGARLGVAEIAGSETRMAAPVGTIPDSVDETSALLSRLLPEFQEDSLWSRMKLIILFSAIALIATVFLVRVMLTDTSPQRIITTLAPDEQVDSSSVSQLPAVAPVQPTRSIFGPAPFNERPTFLGSGVPMIIADAADQSPGLAVHLDEIARKLSVSDEPSEAVYQNWKITIDTIAHGWLLVDDATRESIRKAMLDVLFAASVKPSVLDRLLNEITPLSGRLADPVDIIRGAYLSGTVGQLCGTSLPPIVTERTKQMLSIALEGTNQAGLTTFDSAARAWLLHILPALAERTSYDGRAFDYWELWISAIRRVSGETNEKSHQTLLDDAYLRAMIVLMNDQPDLTTDNPTARIVGRLASLLDYNDNFTVRLGVLALFENERISAQDLWILTSMLVEYQKLPWMSNDLILPPEADIFHRRRIAARWKSQWPQPVLVRSGGDATDTRRLQVDSELFERWEGLLDELSLRAESSSNLERMYHVIAISRLNEAAGVMLKQDVARAQDILDAISDALLRESSASARPPNVSPPVRSSSKPPIIISRPGARPSVIQRRRNATGQSNVPRPGQALGIDGQWAALYEQASRNAGEKLNLLNTLRNAAGTDLGPIDAKVFVNEVYRGTPQDVRALAQSIVVAQFSNGPTVVMQMLDQFVHAGTSREISNCIERLTGQTLPPARAPSWRRQVRLALIQHALVLHQSRAPDIQTAEQRLAESYANRVQLLVRDGPATGSPNDADLAASELREAWRRLAMLLISTAPTPDDLPGLARRHDVRQNLAQGPVQRFVANQIAIMELLAFVTTAERPASRDDVITILHESAKQRTDVTSVLDQSIEVELTIARLWRVRMGGAGQTPTATETSEP